MQLEAWKVRLYPYTQELVRVRKRRSKQTTQRCKLAPGDLGKSWAWASVHSSKLQDPWGATAKAVKQRGHKGERGTTTAAGPRAEGPGSPVAHTEAALPCGMGSRPPISEFLGAVLSHHHRYDKTRASAPWQRCAKTAPPEAGPTGRQSPEDGGGQLHQH